MFVLVGSRAADHHGLRLRSALHLSDYDVVGLRKDYEAFKSSILKDEIESERESTRDAGKYTLIRRDGMRFEYDGTDAPSNFKLIEIMGKAMGDTDLAGNTLVVIPLHLLYLIKRSHANFPNKFDKTISDLIQLKRFLKTPLLPEEEAFFQALRVETARRYGHLRTDIRYRPPRGLFMSGAATPGKQDPALIRRICSPEGMPASEQLAFDPARGAFDEGRFMDLDPESRINLLRLEAMVLGLEEFHIPSNGSLSPRFVYLYGLKRFILNACKGWCQDFALDHIGELVDPKLDFVERYRAAIAAPINLARPPEEG